MISIILSSVVAYLLGSINFAIIITKVFFKKDIRDYGSKNAGMTNVLRNMGKGPAIITLLGDFLKGVLAILISRWIFKYMGSDYGLVYTQYIAAIFALIGHVYPIFHGFKGGKGIAVTAGVMVILNPVVFLITLGVFLISFLLSKMVSLSSLISTICFPVLILLFNIGKTSQTMITELILSSIMVLIIVFMHRDNIKRIKNKTEHKFTSKKGGDK